MGNRPDSGDDGSLVASEADVLGFVLGWPSTVDVQTAGTTLEPLLAVGRGSTRGNDPRRLVDDALQAFPRPDVEAVPEPSSQAWNRFRGTSQRRPTRVAGMEPLRTHS